MAMAFSSTSRPAPPTPRSDAYGGSLENRARLVREVIEEAREETRGAMAIS